MENNNQNNFIQPGGINKYSQDYKIKIDEEYDKNPWKKFKF